MTTGLLDSSVVIDWQDPEVVRDLRATVGPARYRAAVDVKWWVVVIPSIITGLVTATGVTWSNVVANATTGATPSSESST